MDLDKISVQKLECESGRIELSEKLNSLHKNELEPLQTDINSLRLKYGLSKLKSLQEEKEDAMKKYLENRRSRGERSTEVTNAEHAQKPKRGSKKQRRS
ncbi:hypothetical protein HDV02_006529 [Globomyces sp. JEL0801]|nr:hypothetical protein HDV02_006529 [Globomyces sp. JEL0801]